MSNTKTIIVVGGGSAGWMAAGYLSAKGHAVTLIESPTVGVIGVGESTVPAIGWLANEMGMTESEWMPLARATTKLGIRHEDWTQGGSHWNNWFLYDRTKHISQHQYLFGDLPPFEQLEYGYHVDAHQFGETICKTAALRHNCKHVVAHIHSIEGSPETGIQRLVDTEGTEYTADFYVDATGFRKLLTGVVQAHYEPYTDFINDRAIACSQPPLPHLNRYTTTKARECGWIWEIPLTDRRGTGYVYSSRHITDEQALAEYIREYPGTDPGTVSYLKFKPEVCTESIKQNVAAVGLSGGFIEPLEATSLFLTYLMVVQTHKHFAEQRPAAALNRNLKKVFDHTAKFVLAHYTLSGRQHNEYWRYYKKLESKVHSLEYVQQQAGLPDRLEWDSTRLFAPYNHWALLDGYGLREK
jgi:tryptophan halogenase